MKRRLILLTLIVVGLAVVGWVSGRGLSLPDLARQEQSLRSTIASRPVTAVTAGFVVYFLASLVPGTRGKAVVYGWLFGFVPALLLVNLALTAAACVAFLMSRYLVRDFVQSRYGAVLFRVNQALTRDGASYVLALRVLPTSFSLTNYLLGATKLETRTYWWSTQLGLLPGNIVFVLVGARLPSLHQVAQHGILSLFSWQLLLSLTALSVCPILLQCLVRRWQRRRGPAAAAEQPGME